MQNTITVKGKTIDVIHAYPYRDRKQEQEKLIIAVSAEKYGFEELKEMLEGTEETIVYQEEGTLNEYKDYCRDFMGQYDSNAKTFEITLRRRNDLDRRQDEMDRCMLEMGIDMDWRLSKMELGL